MHLALTSLTRSRAGGGRRWAERRSPEPAARFFLFKGPPSLSCMLLFSTLNLNRKP
jgi:hypothetical protein